MRGAKEVRGKGGETELHKRESTMKENKNPIEGGPQEGEERGWHHSPRQKPSRGRRGGGRGVEDDFSGVEI